MKRILILGLTFILIGFKSFSQEFIKTDLTYSNYKLKVDSVFIIKKLLFSDSITCQFLAGIYQQAWEDIIFERLNKQIYYNIGLTINSKELSENITGGKIHPFIQQLFVDETTGVFNKESLVQFLDNLDHAEPEIKNFWLDLEHTIINDLLTDKYLNVITNLIYTNHIQIYFDSIEHSNAVDFEYLKFPFDSLNNNYLISESEYLTYYNNNKLLFYNEMESRDINYIIFSSLNLAKNFKAKNDYKILNTVIDPVKSEIKLKKTHDCFANLNNTKVLLKWTFSAELNDLSDILVLNDSTYIIAKLVKINPNGILPLTSVKGYLEDKIVKQKKADYITLKLNEDIKKSISIKEIAKNHSLNIDTCFDVSYFNSSADKLGFEPIIISVSNTIASNTLSKPIIGNEGIFLINVIKRTQLQSNNTDKIKNWNSSQTIGRFSRWHVFEELQMHYLKIEDNRLFNSTSYFIVQNTALKNSLQNSEYAQNLLFELEYLLRDSINKINITAFEQIIDMYPNTCQSNLSKLYAGMVCINIGEYQKSISYLSEFKSNDIILNCMVTCLIGDNYVEQKMFSKGLEFYNLAANKINDNLIKPYILFKIGQVYEFQKDYPKAILKYQEILNTSPQSVESTKNIARCNVLLK